HPFRVVPNLTSRYSIPKFVEKLQLHLLIQVCGSFVIQLSEPHSLRLPLHPIRQHWIGVVALELKVRNRVSCLDSGLEPANRVQVFKVRVYGLLFAICAKMFRLSFIAFSARRHEIYRQKAELWPPLLRQVVVKFRSGSSKTV